MRAVLIVCLLAASCGPAPRQTYYPPITPIENQVTSVPTPSKVARYTPRPARGGAQAALDTAVITAAQAVTRDAMRDPDSVQFREVRAVPYEGREDHRFVCGEVNAKNAYGGYVGFKHFLVVVKIGAAPGELLVSDPVIDPSTYGQPERNLMAQRCRGTQSFRGGPITLPPSNQR